MGSRKDFDMEAYIQKRMMEIKELEERVLYKEIVGNLLKELYRYSENAYQELEQKVLGEEKTEQTRYAIYITLSDLQHYDATDSFMFPMVAEDTQKRVILCEDIINALQNHGEMQIYTIFLKANAISLYQIIHENREFQGIIQTENREYRGIFRVKQCKKYLELIRNLYYIFVANYQSWTTVCEAYLMKMLDVYLYSAEEIKKGEVIQKIKVDFEEYEDMVAYDMIPLWNLKEIKEKTSTYPEPAIDRINYEHQIFSHRLSRECEYLVKNTDIEITNIRRMNGDLFISCPVDKPQEWSLYQVNKDMGEGKYTYPVLSNQYKESFSGSLAEMYRKSIKTKAEMGRFIESFPVGNCLKFYGYEITEHVPDGWETCNYSMDGFIQDEIRIGSMSLVLVIFFIPQKPEYYLNEDIMSFLVTQVQKIFPEYLCIGKILY